MEVGIRELKRRLSEFVERAARGDMIQVTDRGKPKAILGPLPGRVHLEKGIAEGWITAAKRKPEVRHRRRYTSDRTIAAVLSEDRGE